MGWAELKLTDGTPEGTIDLLSIAPAEGFFLIDWTPTTATAKGDGVWQESPFVDGRRLAIKQYTNILDAFTVGIHAGSVDALIRFTQDMRRLLRKASEYWTTNWQSEPVWIEARADCETEKRYSIIMDGRLGEDDNPYADPMIGAGGQFAIQDVTLVLEHDYWTGQEPKTAKRLQLRNHNRYPWVMWSSPGFSNDFRSADAVFNNLPTGNFTAEIYLFGNLNFATSGFIWYKTNWFVRVDAARTISCHAGHALVNATLVTAATLPVNPQPWTHIRAEFAIATKTWTVYINGVNAGGVPVAGNGAYSGDAGQNLRIGAFSAAGFDLFTDKSTVGSRMTWMRFSTSLRGAGIAGLSYNHIPLPDANSLNITNGCKTFSGAGAGVTAAWTGNIINKYGPSWENPAIFYGVESYLENYTSYSSHPAVIASANCDREGSGIDYAFWFDSSGGNYGNNIIDALPANMLPAVPAVNDCLYLGAGFNQGMCLLNHIVIETTAPITDAFVFEYWTGAVWAAPSLVQTNQNYGQNILTIFGMPTLTAQATYGTFYSGYWYRLRFTGAAPAQRSITSIALVSNPAVEVEDIEPYNDIQGDLEATLRMGLYNIVTENNPGTEYPAQRHLITLYSDGSRDFPRVEGNGIVKSRFTPFINLTCNDGGLSIPSAKPKNQPGIEVYWAAGIVAVASVIAPGYLSNQLNAIAAGASVMQYFRIAYDASLSWRGKYRVFLRATCTTIGDFTCQLTIGAPYYSTVTKVPVNMTPSDELLELGLIDLPGVGDGKELDYQFCLILKNVTGVAKTGYLYDLIFLPFDESTAEYEYDRVPSAGFGFTFDFDDNKYLYSDPILEPKYNRSAIYGILPYPLPATYFDRNDFPKSVGAVTSMSGKTQILQQGTAQKLYCLSAVRQQYWNFRVFLSRTWLLDIQEKYESMRGDR